MNGRNRGDHKKGDRLMKDLELKFPVYMKEYHSFKGTDGKIVPNISNRNFQTEKWITNITEFKLFEEKLYLSPMLDLFNGEIIIYTTGSRLTYSPASTMLAQAFEHVTAKDTLLIHSDQSWHYQTE